MYALLPALRRASARPAVAATLLLCNPHAQRNSSNSRCLCSLQRRQAEQQATNDGGQASSSSRGQPWWLAGATAAAAGATVLAASPPAFADSATMQMQQTQAADAAASARSAAGSSTGDAGPPLVSADNPLSVVIDYLSDATDYALDMMQDMFEHAEARLSGLLRQPSDEPVAVRLLAFAAALLPVIAASGLAYKYTSGSALAKSLYKMYCLLIRVEAGPEPNLLSYLVTNLVFLIGFFTLAVLLGVVNDEVQKRADDQRHGRNPVKAKDHVLILNWNENTPALLQNIAVAIASAAAAAEGSSSSRRNRRAGKVVGGLRGDLWSANPAVVLLADKDKVEMDAAVQEVVRDGGFNLTVHTRQGHPFNRAQLKKVAAHEAAIVVLMHPQGAPTPADAEALKAAAAMAFTTLPARDGQQHHRHWKQQRVVVQMPASVPEAGNVLRSVQSTSADAADDSNLRVQVVSLPDKLLTNRLVAQTAAQPGLLTVWLDILATDASSTNFICLRLPPDMEGKTYRDIRRAFSEDIVCGYVEPKGTVLLNPSDDSRPVPGSKLVLLTNGTGTLSTARNRLDQQESSRHMFEHAAQLAARRLRWGSGCKYQPRHIIVAAWASNHTGELLRSFAEFAPSGSTVTFISTTPPAKRLPKQLGNVRRFEHITHDHPTSMEALQAAGLKGADCVVVGTGPGNPSDAAADARVLASLLQVQEAVQRLQLRQAPHVVAPICEVGSSNMVLRYLDKLKDARQLQLLQQAQEQQQRQQSTWRGRGSSNSSTSSTISPDTVLKPEFLIFRNLTSAVVAQAASEPAYADIVSALLFNKEGQEIYLRPPSFFRIPYNQPISFAEVQELARATGQTALGYITHITSNDRQSSAAADGDGAAAENGSGGSSSSNSGSNRSGGGGDGARRLMPWVNSVVSQLSRAATVHHGLSAADQVVLREGDYVVVLAEDF